MLSEFRVSAKARHRLTFWQPDCSPNLTDEVVVRFLAGPPTAIQPGRSATQPQRNTAGSHPGLPSVRSGHIRADDNHYRRFSVSPELLERP